MEANDPVNDVLKKLKVTTPEDLHPLLDAYEDAGIDGMGDAWREIIQEITNADS